jgi:Flp pilus assembly protein TadG
MKKTKTERGQSLVELAISLVLLLLLLSGAVEFGIAFFQFVQLRDAAQEGALYGSMNPTDCTNIVARVKGASNSPINLNGTGVTIDVKVIDGSTNNEHTCGTSAAAPYDCEKAVAGAPTNGIKVTVTYDHQVFMPFLSTIVGSTIPLSARVTDTILSPVCP